MDEEKLVNVVDEEGDDPWFDPYPTIRDEVGDYGTANPWDAPGMRLSDFL